MAKPEANTEDEKLKPAEKPVSLRPLTFEDAVRELLKTGSHNKNVRRETD